MRKKTFSTKFFSKFLASFGLLLAAACLFNSCQKDMNKSNAEFNTEKSQKISPNVAGDCLPGYHWDPILRRCVQNDITVTYAGVSITYEPGNGILNFNSINDVNTVINQLDTDYDTYNDNYDNQYPNYTTDQLDSMDVINNFDEFKKLKDFENLFSGYLSKRKQIENTENTWLANNMTGTDPDNIDLTFDNAENTIFNSSYSFKIGNNVYQLTSNGLYVNGVLQQGTESNSLMSPAFTTCKSNKKIKSPPYIPAGTNRQFILKVAINSIGVRSSIKTKVVHYKLKNGYWKRSRASLAAGIIGYVYSPACVSLGNKSKSNPTTGYKKRRQLKAKDWACCTIWKTNSGELTGSFATPEGYGGPLPLTW